MGRIEPIRIELEQIISRCDASGRVIISIMASAGMGLGAMPGIEVEDLTRVDHLKLYIYKIMVHARSKKDRSTLSVPLNVLRQLTNTLHSEISMERPLISTLPQSETYLIKTLDLQHLNQDL